MSQFEIIPGIPTTEAESAQCEAPIVNLAEVALSEITQLNLDDLVDPTIRDAETVTFQAGSSGS